MSTPASPALRGFPSERAHATSRAARVSNDDWSRMMATEVLLSGPVTRTELADRLGLSNATITRLAAPLLERGIIVEEPAETAARIGRPSHPLNVSPEDHHFIGVRLTASDVQAVLTDFRAETIGHHRVRLPQGADGSQHSPAEIVTAITTAVAALTTPERPIRGVGLCLGGQIDEDGTVSWAPYLGWRNVPIGGLVEAALGIPVTVENDLAALTNAEHWFGRGRGLDQFAVVTLGVGIGLGLVINNRFITGRDAGLGLAGHLPLDPSGPRCPRGHRGCAKALLSTGGIEAALEERRGEATDFATGFDLARGGEPTSREVFSASVEALGRFLSIIANVALPERIIVTGEGIDLAKFDEPALHAEIGALRADLAAPVDLTLHRTKPYMWARGAAVTAIQGYLGARA